MHAASDHRRIAIAVDLSSESAFAVQWAVDNYLRQGDAVIILHVSPTSVLYGADWGAADVDAEENVTVKKKDPDASTAAKVHDLASPLTKAGFPFKIHIVKDHDMKERLCLEMERLGPDAVIMGSRGIGAASRASSKAGLGSVSDYCVRHCVCPVVVVRCPEERGKVVDPIVEMHTGSQVEEDCGDGLCRCNDGEEEEEEIEAASPHEASEIRDT